MPVSEKALLEACRVLFGSELRVSREFLAYLQISGVKRAFRQRAKETHPDHSERSLSREVVDISSFTAVREAYTALEEYICRREMLTRPLRNHHGFSESHKQRRREKPDVNRADYAAYNRPFTASKKYPRYKERNIPSRYLKFGRYLYHAGAVQWQDVINALVWQRSGRPRLGELAYSRGFLSEDEVRRIYTYPMRGHRFGEQAVVMGLLTREQLISLIRSQQLQQQKIGRYFVLQEILAQRDLYLLIQQCSIHNFRFPKV